MPYVYILKLLKENYYVGSCRDLSIRINQHKRGYVKSTRNKLPFVMVYARLFKTYKEAYREELRIKSWKKRKSIENLYNKDSKNLIKHGPIV